MRLLAALVAAGLLAGCMSTVRYHRPAAGPPTGSNLVLIDKPSDAAWADAVNGVGRLPFKVLALDEAAGRITLAYAGDPLPYVDCGRVVSQVSDARGRRTHDFPAAIGQKTYEVMGPDGGLFVVDRTLRLESRVTVNLEQVGRFQSRATAAADYQLERERVVRLEGGVPSQPLRDGMQFTSMTPGAFAPSPDGQTTQCRSNGRLEQEVLRAVEASRTQAPDATPFSGLLP